MAAFVLPVPASARTLVLGTARPEETGRDHPFTGLVSELGQSGQLSEFPLSPLSVEEAAALGLQIAGRECDPAFLSGLYQATKGNPLFVVESVRASLEDGSVRELGTAARAGRDRRRVSRNCRRPLTSWRGSPPPSAGRSPSICSPKPRIGTRTACRARWKNCGSAASSTGRARGLTITRTTFLREVAYSELSPIRTRSLHRRVARALEELYAPDLEGVSGWLAAHYDAAGMAEQAIRYYRAAAAVAKQRFADAEAADQIRRALRLCRDFPESAKRDKEEIELLVTLGPSLVTTQGYSMPEVGETYERGLLLSRRSGDRKHFFSLLSGAWLFHIVRGELEESRRLGQDCVDGSARGRRSGSGDGRPLSAGEQPVSPGAARGVAWSRSEQVDTDRRRPLRSRFGALRRPGPRCLLPVLSVAPAAGNWATPERLRRRARRPSLWPAKLSHPFSLAIALDYAAMLNVFRQEGKLALARAEEASAICRKHGFAYYLAWAEILAGWAIAVGRRRRGWVVRVSAAGSMR